MVGTTRFKLVNLKLEEYTLDKFIVTFSDEIVGLTAIPHQLNHYLLREAKAQSRYVRSKFEVIGANYDKAIGFMGGENLTYIWSADLDDGFEQLEIYRKGYSIPIASITRSFAWKGCPHHIRSAESLAHNWGLNKANFEKQAAVTVVNLLDHIVMNWMALDYNAIQTRVVDDLFNNFKLEDYQ